tara:strand:- start:86 stop:1039 length:954 start_codon:yes stop_codon:yes gene_type:complete
LNFKDTIYKYREIVESHLKDVYLSGPENMVETSNFVMSAKGKRIRPILTMLSCDALGGNVKQSIDVAIAIELLHNFTLVHDDIMDGDNLRHGQPTVHNKWDIGTAVLTGDSLLWLSLNILKNVKKDREKILLYFIDAIKLVCEGQAYDKMFESENRVSISEYEKMIRMKTGHMIGLCSHLGALCSGASYDVQNKMKNYGLEIGKAYQIQDDYLEIYSNENDMKKSLLSDIELNKKTYMICLAFDLDSDSLDQILSSKQDPVNKIKDLRAYFDKWNIREKTIEEINNSFSRANQILNGIDFKRNHLMDLNNYLINRRY